MKQDDSTMTTWDAFFGPNVGYALDLYERFRRDPNSVDAKTRAFFEQAGPLPEATGGNGSAPAPDTTSRSISGDDVGRIVAAARLARSIREYGHLAAKIDPLGAPRPGDPMLDPQTHHIDEGDLRALPAAIVWPAAGADQGTCLDAIERLRAIYSGPLGYEFDQVQDYEERNWLHQAMEADQFRPPLTPEKRRALLQRLTEVESFERFLGRVFVGQKRFSIEGTDCLVPMLDELIRRSAETGTLEILIGMAHRGRLNVRAHILGKPYAAIFSEFHGSPNKEMVPSEGSTGINSGWSGDVKYHLGAHRTLHESSTVEVQLTLADNPSHLEFVNPVVEGFTRAAQDNRSQPGPPTHDEHQALAVTIHGDAAFPGEGVVAETLNMSRLAGYQTGGTIHIIVNNQIGFTTPAAEGRSTLYASDLAKGYEIPIVHVNADDPEACLSSVMLAHAYRDRFHKDVLIDLVGYRRHGHNEGDEPSFTQPAMYTAIEQHPTVRDLYAQFLIAQGFVSAADVKTMQDEVTARLEQAREEMSPVHADPAQFHFGEPVRSQPVVKAVAAEQLRAIHTSLLALPEGFEPLRKIESQLKRRAQALDAEGTIDWALAEALAFGAILADGTPIRLTGQDTARGTFSQRHLALFDRATGTAWTPLQFLPEARASFAVYNSPLAEAAPIGFEYGYSVHAPEALVVWEAQFGDFANAGQVLIDQFLVAAHAKWRQSPALVLLLPHGYEGQGPEHSSGRLERYLQLAAEDNLRVANCTTAAQYYHLLRLQAAALQSDRRPLVVMTPKSLLRHAKAGSSLRDLVDGSFLPVLDDRNAMDRRQQVERLVLCSGKVAVDLTTTAQTRPEPVEWVAVARLEQLYPFPQEELERVIAGYPNLEEIVWLQEEPRNMGAWSFVAPRLQQMLPADLPARYIGRPERASTAEGSVVTHAREQARIVEEAFQRGAASERQAKIETRGVQHVS